MLWAFAWASGMPFLASEEWSGPFFEVSSEALACEGRVCGEWNGKRILPDHWAEAGLTQLITPAHDIFPSSLRFSVTTGPSRWGYGRMWWVWDQPKLPAGISVSDFTGAYAAFGTGGQSITVLPSLDMVVAHKVEIEGDSPGDMSPLEQSTILQMLIATRCKDPCK